MTRPRFALPQLMVILADIAILFAIPYLIYDAFSDTLNRANASYLEMRADQRLVYAASDPANASMHLRWHEQYKHEAQQFRSAIGWGRLRSLTLLGLAIGLLAWQFRLRWLAALFSIGSVVALLISSEANQLIPGLGLVVFVVIGILPATIVALLVFAFKPSPNSSPKYETPEV
jgi:hypothetical protein